MSCGLDWTRHHLLIRYFVEEEGADAATQDQRQAARGLIESGLDFDDALHHASCRACEAIASFDDRGFARRIRQLNLSPRVVIPTPLK